MGVAAIQEYQFQSADRLENFHGNQLLYIGWDQHLMFCAPFCLPLSPNMRFGDVIEKVLPGVFGYHPDFAKIDWSKAEWLKSSQPWQADFDQTLAELGLKHKDVLRFRTPGLTGIKGSAS